MADDAYAVLPAGPQAAARLLLLRLCDAGDDGDLSLRRRLPIAEAADERDPDARVALETLTDRRLLTIDSDAVEIAHEALLREWPRLRAWLDEDVQGRRLHRRLHDAARSWEAAGHDPSELYRGARLGAASEWAVSHDNELSQAEGAFLASSQAQSEQELADARRQATDRARANRRLRIQLGAIAVALVVALVVGVVAVNQRERANEEAVVAEARELAAAAMANLDSDPERSILLALEAVDHTRSDGGSVLPEAEEALHRAVTESRIVLRVPGVGGVLDWSPDGTTFVTEGPEDEGLVDIRDAETGESVHSFQGHDLDINDVAFSHDGSMLATAGDDGAARVWDPQTGEKLQTFETPDDQIVWGLSFSPDDSRLAVVSLGDQLVRVMDLATGRTVREIPSRGAHFAMFSPDGERLALVGEGDPAAVVVDATTGDEVFTLQGHRLGLRDVAWSPDGRWIATSSSDATARIWEATTGQLRFTLLGHGADVVGVDWSSDSSRLITGSFDGTARLWRVTDQGATEVFSLSTHDTRSGLWGVAFSPGGDRVMAGNLSNSAANVWDVSLAGDREWAHLPAVPAFVGSAAFTPDGRRLVASSADGSVTVWDPETGKPLLTFGAQDSVGEPANADVFAIDQLLDRPSGADVHAIAVSPDGERIATASAAGSATVWDATTGEEAFTLESDGPLYDVAWSPDGRLLAVAGVELDRGVVTMVDRSGTEVGVLRDERGVHVTDVGFSPDGRLLVTAREPEGRFDPTFSEVAIWDWEQREVVRTIETLADSAVFDPTGTRLATTGRVDGLADIWDARTGQRLVTFAGHTGLIYDVAFSPDGSRLATAGLDGTVRQWDVESGSQTLVLRGHNGLVSAVAFSPDATKLASVSGEGTVRVWALDLDDLIEIAEDKLTRTLTDEECSQYLHVDRCPQA
jgi:WD40 repeat protein